MKRPFWPPRPVSLHAQIIAAMVLALGLAFVLPRDLALAGVPLATICDFFGTLFLNALKMLVVPLVFSSLVVAVANLGAGPDFQRLFGRMAGWVIATGLVAATVGLVLVNLIGPGRGLGEMEGRPAAPSVSVQVADRGLADVARVVQDIVPVNVVAAGAEGKLLSIVFFALVFGFFQARQPAARAEALLVFWQGMFGVMIDLARWVLRAAPAGVFFLFLKSLLTYGFGALGALGVYMLTVLAGLGFHALVVLPLLVLVFARVSPARLFQAVLPAVLTAFSTSSSKAALPANLDAMERNVGISPRVARFALPLTATVNMNGTALYECVAAVFIAQFYGIDLALGQQVSLVLVALLTTLGSSGMPGGGVIGLAIVLGVAGLPAEGIALVLGVDRLLDMTRTAVNVWSDACVTTLLAVGEGEAPLPAGAS